MKLTTITTAIALGAAILLTTAGPAFAQKVKPDSPTAAMDAMIAQKAAELKELRARRAAVRDAARAENRTSAIQRAEARLEALRAGKAATKPGGKG